MDTGCLCKVGYPPRALDSVLSHRQCPAAVDDDYDCDSPPPLLLLVMLDGATPVLLSPPAAPVGFFSRGTHNIDGLGSSGMICG